MKTLPTTELWVSGRLTLAVVIHGDAVVDEVVDEYQLARARQRIAFHLVRHEIADHGDASAAGGRSQQYAIAMLHEARAGGVGMKRVVQWLREDVVGESDVVVGTPDARHFVDGPAERAMVDDHVRHGFFRAALELERIAVVGIRAVRIVAGAHANVLHQDVEV